MSAVYVYALTDRPLRAIRAAGERLVALPLDGVYAIASRRTSAPVLSEESLRRQHDAVERVAARADAVLPVRFGAFVETDELRRVVAERREAIQAALARVRRRRQMTVRVIGDPAPREAVAPASGAEYLRARVWLDPRAAQPLDAIRQAVARWVVEERVERGRGSTLATLYHLVAAEDVERYRAAASDVRVDDVLVRVSGPWPAFAFAPELLA
jgi:hypothetical protein